MKPNRQDTYDRKRDYLAVNTSLYEIEQVLELTQLSNPDVDLSNSNRITYASKFLTGNSEVWWCTMVQDDIVPSTCEEFSAKVGAELIPEDHIRRSRES